MPLAYNAVLCAATADAGRPRSTAHCDHLTRCLINLGHRRAFGVTRSSGAQSRSGLAGPCWVWQRRGLEIPEDFLAGRHWGQPDCSDRGQLVTVDFFSRGAFRSKPYNVIMLGLNFEHKKRCVKFEHFRKTRICSASRTQAPCPAAVPFLVTTSAAKSRS